MSEIDTAAHDPGTCSPGTILRRCREYHGNTVEEAAEATKIAAHHLRALEDDRVGDFASLTYLRGFLKIYAGHLGLNPDDLMRLYERLDAAGDDREAGSAEGDEGRGKGGRRRFPWQKLALPALLLSLMILTSLLYNRTSAPPRPAAAPRPAVVTPVTAIQPVRSSAALAAAPPSSQEEEQEEGAAGEETVTDQAAPHEGQHDSGRGFVVRLRVVQNGSLTVSIDGEAAQSFELASGDVLEWKADRNIALELSDAGSVDGELNGKPLRAFGPHGVPASVVLGPGGIQ